MAVNLVFRVHALRRMFERRFGIDDVKAVIASGETIESYRDDRPYPSRLVPSWRGERPMHVLVADNSSENEIVVITVYEPDPNLWGEAGRRRRT
jgi:hypothetical protein